MSCVTSRGTSPCRVKCHADHRSPASPWRRGAPKVVQTAGAGRSVQRRPSGTHPAPAGSDPGERQRAGDRTGRGMHRPQPVMPCRSGSVAFQQRREQHGPRSAARDATEDGQSISQVRSTGECCDRTGQRRRGHAAYLSAQKMPRLKRRGVALFGLLLEPDMAAPNGANEVVEVFGTEVVPNAF